jgi:hypothetical protein
MAHWLHRAVSMVVAGVTVGLAVSLTAQTLHATDELQPTPAGSELGAIPPEENAAEWLMAGGCAIDPTEYARGAIGEASLRRFSEWSPELVDSVRQSLDRQQAALEMLHRAATLDRSSYVFEYRRGLDAEVPDREVPDMLPLVKACRLLLAEARVAAADGDRQRALTALATMGRLASSLERESSMLTALIGIACERMMLAAAAETLVCGQPWTADRGFVEQLAETLSAEDLRAMMGRALEFSNIQGPEAATEPSSVADEWARAEFERAHAIVRELIDAPYGSAPGWNSSPQAEGVVAGLVLVNLRSAIARHQAALAQRQLVRSATALRRIAIAEGGYPADRAAVPELIGPDPFTGRPLLYSVREDRSAEVALDGADELLAEIVAKSAASVPPIVLPAP